MKFGSLFLRTRESNFNIDLVNKFVDIDGLEVNHKTKSARIRKF
jgi:hypothetical protein